MKEVTPKSIDDYQQCQEHRGRFVIFSLENALNHPIWIDAPSEPVDTSRTTFVIPFRETTDASRIADEIKKIRLELYLFLRWLKRIDIIDEISGEHWTLENLGENQEGISTLKSNGEEQRFKFFRRNVEVPDWVKDDRLTQEYRANVTKHASGVFVFLIHISSKTSNVSPFKWPKIHAIGFTLKSCEIAIK